MNIKIKKNGYLILDKLKFKCVFGKSGIKTRKLEGDKATPRGIYSLGKLYYRKDRLGKITTFLKKKIIKKNTGWCHNVKNKKYPGKLSPSHIPTAKHTISHEEPL